MKSLIISSIAMLFSLMVSAQGAMDQLPISVIPSKNNSDLSTKQQQLLLNKTKQMVTSNGLSAEGSQQFAIYPEFAILDEENIEMLTTITKIEGEVTFTVIQRDNNIVFNSAVVAVKGHAEKRSQAITNAIRSLRPRELPFVNFMKETKEEIAEYYNKQCPTLVEDASRLSKMQQYEEALGILFSIPPTVDCHLTARKRANQVYFSWQEQECSEWVLKGRALMENNKYAAALRILGQVDPKSICFSEASGLLTQIGEKVDVKDELIWNTMEQRYQNGLTLEARRLKVMRDIAVAYYQQPNLWIIR